MFSVSIYGKGFFEVYDSCVSGITDATKERRFKDERDDLEKESRKYEALARASCLFQIKSSKTRLTELVWGGLTRKDLKELYEVNMVGVGKSARVHYDSILMSPRYKKCPYCGLGQATTLDHYLPKSRFPQFSVSVCNLVPSCKDCQSKKGREYARTKRAQTLHPYFDRAEFFSEAWVKAKVLPGPVTSASFYVDAPSVWSQEMKDRVEAHFSAHRLDERFSVEAACELASVKEMMADLRDARDHMQIRLLLARSARAHLKVCANSWKAALYDALANDDWYCSAPQV